ncbi:calcineurin-like phosphoesterase family protein [Dyadobacter jejuensis]|uniref:Calcineurin-like phosphoesterase family protein n=2 Tax=Dyadobacter jejuensis TaxID=1082580 RepID=A0A316AK35_9BACT|nr:calcineurin-like phosphoesterase family protein [Dyadobacter jejuensis]
MYWLLVASGLSACAGYKTQYSPLGSQWAEEQPDSSTITHTMYLIGDAGNDSPDDQAPVLTYLKGKLATESANSSILFLGDNIYPSGMPPEEDSLNRSIAEYRLTSQLEILDEFKGRPVFIPGNHDWRGWGGKGLARQQKFVQKYINKHRGVKDKDDYEDYFLPLDGCSGPEVIELNDDVVVVVVDSQWWLMDWDKEPKMNDGCEIKNREHFKFVFENVIRKYRSKKVVIAMHHPPYTYGPHGGRFTWKQHLFPLTEMKPNLYIPLPGLGSLSALFRGTIGSRQDMANKRYKDLRRALFAGANKNGSFIFASGHEHGLQFIQDENHSFIVSGSGSKKSPVGMGKGSQFASTEPGFSTIQYYENGQVWTNFYAVSPDGLQAKVIFRKRLKDKVQPEPEMGLNAPAVPALAKDSVDHFVTMHQAAKTGGLHGFLFGEHHRNLYQQPYTFRVMDLSQERGGLTPVKLGGGNQTNSLRLEAADGKEYVLRGLAKDVSRFIPFPFNKMTAAKYVVEDNFLSTNPFAPLSMPVLADAIEVYHTNPQLVFVPEQPALSDYNGIVGGTMNLYEERPKGKHWKDAAFFGNPHKIVGTADVVEEILDDPDSRVDEAWMLRTRMLDFLVGDWDRHDDQWAWASIDQSKGRTLFRPIPKDRDQAFSLYDGLVTGLARFTQPFLRQLQSFGPEVKNVKWSTWSARLVDRTFLNGLSWAEWQQQAFFIQAKLTDEVIDSAFDSWPPEARRLASPAIAQNIKSRRDRLMDIARQHYAIVSESVDVIGTNKEEYFEVDRINDQQLRVRIYDLSKKGKLKNKRYDRTFDQDITRSVQIYGVGDDDTFVLLGEGTPSIKVRWIGGLGKDRFIDETKDSPIGKKIWVYDDLRNNKFQKSPHFKDLRTSQYRYNIYDRRSADSNYDILMPIPVVGYNPDDGLLLGGGLSYTRYGFKKAPYASFQKASLRYAFGTKSIILDYTGDFLNTFGQWDFYLDGHLHGPSYAFNYAGLGNASVRLPKQANFYRVRQRGVALFPAIKKRLGSSDGFFAIGPFAEANKIEQTAGRFITSGKNQLDGQIFDTQYFAGARALLDYKSVDSYSMPHSGIRFKTSLDWTHDLRNQRQFAALKSQLVIYKALDTKENFILATRLGTNVNFGKGYTFFQMPTLGARQGLRGYRAERFYGKSSYWQETDLRVRLNSNYNPTLPLTYGLFGSFDYGRVWMEQDRLENWHYSYGGGVWFAPVDLLTLAVGAFIPREKAEESPRILFQMGFWF